MSAVLIAPPERIYAALFGESFPRVIAAVGGGGKTTFLKTLAAELAAEGARVVVTTTTKMHPPEDASILGTTADEVISLLETTPIVWAGLPLSEGKMTAIPDSLPRLKASADYVLVEADGSRKRPLKMTDPAYEPRIPPEADAVVALAGLDSLGRPIREAVHRPALACPVLKKGADSPVTREDIACLLSHCYNPRYVLLNKADTPALREEACRIAALLPEARCLIASLRLWGQAETR